MKKFLVIPAVLILAGCETPEEQVQRLLPAAEKSCDAYGFKKDTPQYSQCLQTEVNRLANNETAAAAAIADAADSFNQSYNQASYTPVTCTTTGTGWTAVTTCF